MRICAMGSGFVVLGDQLQGVAHHFVDGLARLVGRHAAVAVAHCHGAPPGVQADAHLRRSLNRGFDVGRRHPAGEEVVLVGDGGHAAQQRLHHAGSGHRRDRLGGEVPVVPPLHAQPPETCQPRPEGGSLQLGDAAQTHLVEVLVGVDHARQHQQPRSVQHLPRRVPAPSVRSRRCVPRQCAGRRRAAPGRRRRKSPDGRYRAAGGPARASVCQTLRDCEPTSSALAKSGTGKRSVGAAEWFNWRTRSAVLRSDYEAAAAEARGRLGYDVYAPAAGLNGCIARLAPSPTLLGCGSTSSPMRLETSTSATRPEPRSISSSQR